MYESVGKADLLLDHIDSKNPGRLLIYSSLVISLLAFPKRIYCIEAQERGKNFALIVKSSLFEGIFIDAKGVNFASLEIVRAKKYFM